MFFKLFDTMIHSMLNVVVEVWGLDADHTPIERILISCSEKAGF